MPSLASLLMAAVMIVAQSVGGAHPPASASFRFPWTVHDTRSSPGAFCTYDAGDPRRRVYVPVHMPRIYWPDTHPGRTDSGIVGWRIELQVSTSPGGPWRIAYDSSITRGRATDGHPASVPKLAVNWRLLHRVGAWYRVKLRAFWYRPDGTRLASRSRYIHWYRLARAEHRWSAGSPGGWLIGDTLGVRHAMCPNLLPR